MGGYLQMLEIINVWGRRSTKKKETAELVTSHHMGQCLHYQMLCQICRSNLLRSKKVYWNKWMP